MSLNIPSILTSIIRSLSSLFVPSDPISDDFPNRDEIKNENIKNFYSALRSKIRAIEDRFDSASEDQKDELALTRGILVHLEFAVRSSIYNRVILEQLINDTKTAINTHNNNAYYFEKKIIALSNSIDELQNTVNTINLEQIRIDLDHIQKTLIIIQKLKESQNDGKNKTE